MPAEAPRLTISAYLIAMERRLRAYLTDNTSDYTKPGKLAGVQPDGRPPPGCGQWYYAADFEGISSPDQNALSDDKRLAASVTITRRMAYAPRDRRGAEMFKGAELLDAAVLIANLFHMDYATMNAANALIAGTAAYQAINGGSVTANGFTTPLKLSSISKPLEELPIWVGGDMTGESTDEKDIYKVVVAFGDAQLIQYASSIQG